MSHDVLIEVIFDLLILLLIEVILLEEALKILELCIEDLVAEGAEVCQLCQLHDGLVEVPENLGPLLLFVLILDRDLVLCRDLVEA